MCEVSKALALLMPATYDSARCGVHKISYVVGCVNMDHLIVLRQPHPTHPSSLVCILVFWLVAEFINTVKMLSFWGRIPIRAVALSKLSVFVNPLVIMSADCS